MTKQVLIGAVPHVDTQVSVFGRRKVPRLKAGGHNVRYAMVIEEVSILSCCVISNVQLALEDGVAFGRHGMVAVDCFVRELSF